MGRELKGMDEVLRNLNSATKGILGATESGVVAAAMYIRKESQKLTPVRLGNLRNSAYVVSSGPNPPQASGGGFKGDNADQMEVDLKKAKLMAEGKVQSLSRHGPVAAIGYGAVYAMAIHENPNAGAAGGSKEADIARQGKKTPLSQIHSKGGEWKFLEKPLKENQQKVLEIIKRKAKF